MRALFLLLLALPAASETLTLTVDGRRRRALLREPRAQAGPRPLVLLLHGGGGSPEQAEQAYGMTEAGLKEGFLVAYPAGSGRFKRFLTWNAGSCCAYALENGVDDVKFLSALVEKLVKDGRADPKRVYVTGMSNGAMMSHRFACERADLVAAIAPVGGTMAVKDCRPAKPVSVLSIHGTKDEHVPFAGGTGKKAKEPRVDRSVRDSASVWAGANGCAPGSGPVGANGDFSWSGCKAGVSVHVVGHEGGHIWPGSEQPRYRGADPMLAEPKTTKLIVDFFNKHARP